VLRIRSAMQPCRRSSTTPCHQNLRRRQSPLTALEGDVSGTGPNTRSSAVSDTDQASVGRCKDLADEGMAPFELPIPIGQPTNSSHLAGHEVSESFRQDALRNRTRTIYRQTGLQRKSAFVDAFSEDFGKSVRAYAREWSENIVFIDDLIAAKYQRC